MADTGPASIRKEVREYLGACVALLKGEPGSHDGFMLASEKLQRRDRKLTENERFLVQEMIFRLSVKLAPPHLQSFLATSKKDGIRSLD